MTSSTISQLPAEIEVTEIVSSRYPNHQRPLSWDRRVEGVDVVKAANGATVRLLSDGQQSPPRRGWSLVLTTGDAERGYRWTLYGIPKGAAVNA